MLSTLIFVLAIGFAVFWRYGRGVVAVGKRILDAGDDIGGLFLAYHFGGKTVAKRGAQLLIGLVGGLVGLILALVSPIARLALAAWLVLAVRSRYRRWKAARAELAASGMTAAERQLMHEAATATFEAMGIVSRSSAQPPRLTKWQKRPVRIGGAKGKAIRGAHLYHVEIEPPQGRSLKEIGDLVGRGLNTHEDKLRDSMNATLRAVSGPKVRQLRRAGLMPKPFTLTTMEWITRNGEPIGLGRLTFWSTDPFRHAVQYPHDVTKPIVRSSSEPVPVGLYRSNREARMALDIHTLVQGINGSGKSSIARPLMLADAHTDSIMVVLALKGANDYIELQSRFAGGVVVTEPAQASNVLRAVYAEVRRRNALTPAELRKLPPIRVYADEAQVLGADIFLLLPIVKEGRSANVTVIGFTQYAPASTKAEDGGMPTTIAREFGQRAAGRIEGDHSNAKVAVGGRISKTAGPHMIPPGKGWRGVLFDDAGEYIRVYWTDTESTPGKLSQLARCAKALGDRPADPLWFVEALSKRVDEPTELPPVEVPQWPLDGAHRAADGSAVRFEFEALDDELQRAVQAVWQAGGRKNAPAGTISASDARKSIANTRKRLDGRAVWSEADHRAHAGAELFERFMNGPLDRSDELVAD